MRRHAKYTKSQLISELHKFVEENDINPVQSDMQGNKNYPNLSTFQKYFGSWNNALIAAGLELNQYQDHWQDGTETCDVCGDTQKYSNWIYKNGLRLCKNCDLNRKGHRWGILNHNCSTGKAFKDEVITKKALDINFNCNIEIGFTAPYDLYDEKFGKINVKSSKLSVNIKNNNKYEYWHFRFSNVYIPDTYIFLGYDEKRTKILKVWVINSKKSIVNNKKSFTISNSSYVLNKYINFEIDAKYFNKILQETNWNECKYLDNDKDIDNNNKKINKRNHNNYNDIDINQDTLSKWD